MGPKKGRLFKRCELINERSDDKTIKKCTKSRHLKVNSGEGPESNFKKEGETIMKKLLALVMAAAMTLSLAACGSKTDTPASSGTAAVSTSDEVFTLSWAHSSSTNDGWLWPPRRWRRS